MFSHLPWYLQIICISCLQILCILDHNTDEKDVLEDLGLPLPAGFPPEDFRLRRLNGTNGAWVLELGIGTTKSDCLQHMYFCKTVSLFFKDLDGA